MSANFWDCVCLITSSNPERKADGDFGTGFVIHQDKQTTYLLTCAHVVEAVGGSDQVKVDGHPATVEAIGDSQGCDLAVLVVRKLLPKLPPLRLSVVGEQGRDVTVAGYYTDGTKTKKQARIKGKLGDTQIINLEGDRTKAWNLEIAQDSKHNLKSGYSGSPVIDEITGYVLGVVAQETGKGNGLAISIEALEKIWSESVSVLLPSEKGVDYIKLRDLLAFGEWRAADLETLAVMLKVADREKERSLRLEDLEKFPCTDLRTINSLWVKYSAGRFGFSIQKRIWESAGEKPGKDDEMEKRFGNCVGWYVNNQWLSYTDLTFSLEAPEGHIPIIGGQDIPLSWFDSTSDYVKVAPILFSHIETCEL